MTHDEAPSQIKAHRLVAILSGEETEAIGLPQLFVAGKAPMQRAMLDVLDALGVEGAIAIGL